MTGREEWKIRNDFGAFTMVVFGRYGAGPMYDFDAQCFQFTEYISSGYGLATFTCIHLTLTAWDRDYQPLSSEMYVFLSLYFS
jgi:hypothetical protein